MSAPTKPRKPVSVDEFVEKVVAAAPPLTPEARAALRDLLTPYAKDPAAPAHAAATEGRRVA